MDVHSTLATELTPDDVELGKAMDQYMRDNDRPFPAWHEVLAVLVSLGYRKVAEPVDPPRYKKFLGRAHGVPYPERE